MASLLHELSMKPDLDRVRSYYDERIDGKIRDFLTSNPRIEAALETLGEWAPKNPKRILEIGCGIGASTWRMASTWTDAEVIGADVSGRSLEVARTCFRRPNLRYIEGLILEGTLTGTFDYIVLMDVYEHVAKEDRPALHRALKSLLSVQGRIFMSVPTPLHLADLRANHPKEIQPVDEDVTPACFSELADFIGVDLLMYRAVGIWRYGDYAHAVIGRMPELTAVGARVSGPGEGSALKKIVRQLRSSGDVLADLPGHLLGRDLLVPRASHGLRLKTVLQQERGRLMEAWKAGGKTR